MPYLPDHDRREKLATGKVLPASGAEINFIICDMLDSFVARHGKNYKVLAEAQSALTMASFEFQRRVVGPYEQERFTECGEVFHASASRPQGTHHHATSVADAL